MHHHPHPLAHAEPGVRNSKTIAARGAGGGRDSRGAALSPGRDTDGCKPERKSFITGLYGWEDKVACRGLTRSRGSGTVPKTRLATRGQIRAGYGRTPENPAIINLHRCIQRPQDEYALHHNTSKWILECDGARVISEGRSMGDGRAQKKGDHERAERRWKPGPHEEHGWESSARVCPWLHRHPFNRVIEVEGNVAIDRSWFGPC